jgi:hypothetical protein
MSRPMILVGCWPRRMCAELAAAYCGEPSTDAFLKRVGREYPQPRVHDGRRRLWLRDDLDQAILPSDLAAVREHSRKPEEACRLIEDLTPCAFGSDAFARERRAGRDAFGNECEKFSSATEGHRR